MSVTLFFGNRLEALADKLLETIGRREGSGQDPLQAPTVVVPNTNLARWLKLVIACRRSICMNMAFEFLDRGLWQMLAALDDDPRAAVPLEMDDRKTLLLYALQQMPADDRQLQPLRRYLEGTSSRGGGGRAVRLWQLTETLARLFSEYELHRDGMIARWRQRIPAADPLEACQQWLYQRLRELADADGEPAAGRLLSLSEYAQQVFSSPPPPGPEPRGEVHFFGLSQISSLHLEIFQQLSAYYAMVIYVVNPCREFWEDISTPAEQRWLRRKNEHHLRILPEEEAAGELQRAADNELLAAWGKPGRESIRRFCALSDYDFLENYVTESPPDTVLKALQHDILTLGGQPVCRPQDDSLQIGACPGITREVETVYNSILYNLQRDESLRLTDIAVLVPDMDVYKPALEAVFSRYPAAVSYNLADARARDESLYGQAVLKLLELCRGRFSRREVFDLLLNPCVMQKWGLGAGDVQTWAQWTSRLNIFHSFDVREKRSRGYTDDPVHTWQQGLLRLRLARVLGDPARMSGEVPGRFAHFRGIVPHGDMAADDPQLLETFCLLLESLHRGVQRLKKLRAGGLGWRDTLFAICDELMQVPRDARGEETVRQELLKAFGRFGRYDRLAGESERARLDIELAIELVKSQLDGIPGGRGEYLTGGVTISALQPMRPIPFRIIYVLGLQEGSFPGRAPQSSLDLQLVRRRIGDVSPPERDRYLFLETLLAARERLYLTYVCRDLQKDREIMAGSVISLLRRYLENRILPPGHEFAVTPVPLKGSDPVYTRPGRGAENGDLLTNFSWGDRVAFYCRHGLWDQARECCTDAVRSGLKRFCPDLTPAAAAHQDRPAVVPLTLGQLHKFIEDPALFAMRQYLGFYEEEPAVEELAEEEDEPFFTPFPADYRLTTEPLAWWLENALDADQRRGPTPERLFEHYYDYLSRQGMTPEGIYAQLDRRVLRGQVAEQAGRLEEILSSMRRAARLYRSVVVGEPGFEGAFTGHRLPRRRFDALELELPQGSWPMTDVRLHGEREWLWRSDDGHWHTLVITGSRRTAQRPSRYVIQPLLFYLAARAHPQMGPWLAAKPFHIHVAYRERLRRFAYIFDRHTARDYLTALAAEVLDQGTIGWLPFDVAAQREKIITAPAEEVTTRDRNAFQAFVLEAFDKAGAEYLTRLARPDIDGGVLDRARARLAPFFDTLERE